MRLPRDKAIPANTVITVMTSCISDPPELRLNSYIGLRRSDLWSTEPASAKVVVSGRATKNVCGLLVAFPANLNHVANANHFEQLLDVPISQANAPMRCGVTNRLGVVGSMNSVTALTETDPARPKGIVVAGRNHHAGVVVSWIGRCAGRSCNSPVGLGLTDAPTETGKVRITLPPSMTASLRSGTLTNIWRGVRLLTFGLELWAFAIWLSGRGTRETQGAGAKSTTSRLALELIFGSCPPPPCSCFGDGILRAALIALNMLLLAARLGTELSSGVDSVSGGIQTKCTTFSMGLCQDGWMQALPELRAARSPTSPWKGTSASFRPGRITRDLVAYVYIAFYSYCGSRQSGGELAIVNQPKFF